MLVICENVSSIGLILGSMEAQPIVEEIWDISVEKPMPMLHQDLNWPSWSIIYHFFLSKGFYHGVSFKTLHPTIVYTRHIIVCADTIIFEIVVPPIYQLWYTPLQLQNYRMLCVCLQVSRLIYTNSGSAVLALLSNALHKLWKWTRNESNPSSKVCYQNYVFGENVVSTVLHW